VDWKKRPTNGKAMTKGLMCRVGVEGVEGRQERNRDGPNNRRQEDETEEVMEEK
jgi:hypothetical protein